MWEPQQGHPRPRSAAPRSQVLDAVVVLGIRSTNASMSIIAEEMDLSPSLGVSLSIASSAPGGGAHRAREPGGRLALLTFNCAPDRLRRLSVDADECPPHVFGVTEADCVRDVFDRFGSRLYAASGQIGAEPLHHTRGCGARLGPECAAELAQAHADRLRQTLDGERLGDVITSMANGSSNPVILWSQIDGRCELGLSAMAAMVDNEVLCHVFGDGKPKVLLDQSQREIDAGRDAS